MATKFATELAIKMTTKFATELDSIKSVFADDLFTIECTDNTSHKVPYNNYTIKETRTTIRICCLNIFYQDSKTIEIIAINKGKNISGTEIMKRIDQIAINESINEIQLEDASDILVCKLNKKYDIPLGLLKILISGQTWYNQLGFYSKNQEIIDRHNYLVIEKTLEDFLTFYADDNIYGYIQDPFLEIWLKRPTKEFFIYIKNELKNNIVDIPLQLILQLFKYIYQNKLVMFAKNMRCYKKIV